jgi:hypothetical protein
MIWVFGSQSFLEIHQLPLEPEVREHDGSLFPNVGHSLHKREAALLHQKGDNAAGTARYPGIAVHKYSSSSLCMHGFFHELNRRLKVPRNIYKGRIKHIYDLICELLRVLRLKTCGYLQNVCHVATLKPCQVARILEVTQIQSI